MVIKPAEADSSSTESEIPLDSAHLDLEAIFSAVRLAKSDVEDSVTEETVDGTNAGVLEKAAAFPTRERIARDGIDNFILE